MRQLLADPDEAKRLGAGARPAAIERFSIHRFAEDGDRVLHQVVGTGSPPSGDPPESACETAPTSRHFAGQNGAVGTRMAARP